MGDYQEYLSDLEWDRTHLNERRKYVELYLDEQGAYRSQQDPRGYGRVNHASELYERIEAMNIRSICDIGCGAGNFCVWAAGFCDRVYGVDIASVVTGNVIAHPKVTYFDSDARSIPLEDGAVEYVTSFDCLEHCLKKDIGAILAEFHRIATRGFIFSIAYKQAKERSNRDELLHMTVKPEKWWIKKISRYADLSGLIHPTKRGHKYLFFTRKP